MLGRAWLALHCATNILSRGRSSTTSSCSCRHRHATAAASVTLPGCLYCTTSIALPGCLYTTAAASITLPGELGYNPPAVLNRSIWVRCNYAALVKASKTPSAALSVPAKPPPLPQMLGAKSRQKPITQVECTTSPIKAAAAPSAALSVPTNPRRCQAARSAPGPPADPPLEQWAG